MNGWDKILNRVIGLQWTRAGLQCHLDVFRSMNSILGLVFILWAYLFCLFIYFLFIVFFSSFICSYKTGHKCLKSLTRTLHKQPDIN